MARTKKQRRRSVFFPILNVILIVAALIAIGMVAYAAYNDMIGDTNGAEPEKFEVGMGWTTTKIANTLEEKGIIESSFFFRLYTAVKFTNPGFNYGKFNISSSMSYDELIAVLRTPYVRKTVSVTFPEGTTALKMAMILAEKHFFVDAKEFEQDYDKAYWKSINLFLEACEYEDAYSSVSFYDEIPDNDLRFCKLEGYLFPDTYQFYSDADPEDVVLKMLKTFESKVYTEKNQALFAASGYTMDEIIIMSSIVQKESSGKLDNCSMVAGVFFNRLNSSTYQYMESCTSSKHLASGFIYGVLDFYYGHAYSTDHDVMRTYVPAGMTTAYNTYNTGGGTKGFIVGAICNPGVNAIEGTLSPGNHNYYFFCTSKSGTFFWGTTYSQHVANVRKAGLGANDTSF